MMKLSYRILRGIKVRRNNGAWIKAHEIVPSPAARKIVKDILEAEACGAGAPGSDEYHGSIEHRDSKWSWKKS